MAEYFGYGPEAEVAEEGDRTPVLMLGNRTVPLLQGHTTQERMKKTREKY